MPADMQADIEKYRNNLLEAISEQDDELMLKYLEGGVQHRRNKKGIRKLR